MLRFGFSLLCLLEAACGIKFSRRSTLISRLSSTVKQSTTIDQDIEIPPLTEQPPLRILLIVEPTPFTYISGYSNRFKEMLNHLHVAGDQVHIFTPDSGSRGPPPDNYLGYPITTVRGYEFPLYKQVTLTFDTRFKIKQLIEEFKPDLVHCVTPSAVIWQALFWAKYYNVPLVLSYHTNFVEYARAYLNTPFFIWLAYFLIQTFHRTGDLVLCTSPQLRDDLLSLGINKIDVWRKGINTQIFSPSFKSAAMRDRLTKGHPSDPLLIYVGRLGREKGLSRLVRVLEENPTCRLAFVGGGPAEGELKKLYQDNDRVNFVGPLTGVALSEAFASSDVFVMPSDSETLGFVVLEAMASGIPVIGVAAGGLIDIIEHGRTGFIVDNDDGMAEFSSKVTHLLQNATLRSDLGAAARLYAEKWSWESATSVLRNTQYRLAISNHARSNRDRDLLDEAVGDLYRPDLAW